MGTRKISFACCCLLLWTLLGRNAEGQADSMQCQRKGETCWCVDHLTGVEIEGSRVLLKQGLPLCGRFETELYYLNSTNVLCSTADEARVNKCLGGLYGTFLDLPYASSNFNHLLFANYVFLSGKLELACRLLKDYHQCSSTAFNGTSCRHCQHMVFMSLFNYLCRPKHLVAIKLQLSCLQGLFMDEIFIQCQLRLLDELKAIQQQGSDPQKLCAIKLQFQVCLLKRLPQYCDQDMTRLLAVLPERVIEGLNVSCEGYFPLSTKSPGATGLGTVTGVAGFSTDISAGEAGIPSHVTSTAISPLPTKMEEGPRAPGAGIVTAEAVPGVLETFRPTPGETELLPSMTGEAVIPSVVPTVFPGPKTEGFITTPGFYPTSSSERPYPVPTPSTAPYSAGGVAIEEWTKTGTPSEGKGTTVQRPVSLGTAEDVYAPYATGATGSSGPGMMRTSPTRLQSPEPAYTSVQPMQTIAPGIKEVAETAYPSVEPMRTIAPGMKEVAAVVAEHSTRFPDIATGPWTPAEWVHVPTAELPEERKTLRPAIPSVFPATTAYGGAEPRGSAPSYEETGAPVAVSSYGPGTTVERTSAPVPTSPWLTELGVRPEITEARAGLPTAPPSVKVTKLGELPETAFVEERTTSTVGTGEPTERGLGLTGGGTGAVEDQMKVPVHHVVPTVGQHVSWRPRPVGRNESELIAPADIDCSGYNMRFTFCFHTHFFSVSLGQLTVESLLNNTWHWPKLAEICRFFHDYLNCMHQPSLNPMGLCDPFGHTALTGMLNAVCEQDVATTLYLHSHCLSSTLRNATWANQCLGAVVDFVRVIHYLPISDSQICQRIREMHSCVNALDLSGCSDDLQFALAKLKLTGLQAESYLCGKYLLGPSLRRQVEWWNRRRANDLPFEELGCEEERRRVLSSSGPTGPYVPRCTARGYYDLVQCDYSIGQCWCVDVETGLEQTNSRKAVTECVVCGSCFIQKSHVLNDTESKQSVPRCLGNGLFAPLQCNFGASECWCVEETTGAEILYTRAHKGRRLPRCGMKSEFSCSWMPPKKRCAPDGSAPKFVLRWFREGWKCTLRPVSFCPHESHLPPFTFRFQSDCEEMCLGPYTARLQVRQIA